MIRTEYIIDDDFLDDETKMSAESQGYLWELIRCKDCEHLKVSGELEHTNGDTTFYYICDHWHRATDEWRYCDQGARRKDDDD